MQEYQITKWEGHLYDDGKDRVRESKYSTEEHDLDFQGYDDDGNLYCTGTCNWDRLFEYDLLDYLARGWGVTLIKLFDRETGKYLDSMD